MPEAFGERPPTPSSSVVTCPPVWGERGHQAGAGTHFIGTGSPSRLPGETQRGEEVTWAWEEAHCQSKLRMTFSKLSESVKRPFLKEVNGGEGDVRDGEEYGGINSDGRRLNMGW